MPQKHTGLILISTIEKRQDLNISDVTGGIRFVEQEEFMQAVDKAEQDPQKAKQMAVLLAYNDLAHGKKTADVLCDNDYALSSQLRLVAYLVGLYRTHADGHRRIRIL